MRPINKEFEELSKKETGIFNIVPMSIETDECIIAIGSEQVSGWIFENRIEAEEYIASKPYELIMSIAIFIATRENNKKSRKENKK